MSIAGHRVAALSSQNFCFPNRPDALSCICSFNSSLGAVCRAVAHFPTLASTRFFRFVVVQLPFVQLPCTYTAGSGKSIFSVSPWHNVIDSLCEPASSGTYTPSPLQSTAWLSSTLRIAPGPGADSTRIS